MFSNFGRYRYRTGKLVNFSQTEELKTLFSEQYLLYML